MVGFEYIWDYSRFIAKKFSKYYSEVTSVVMIIAGKFYLLIVLFVYQLIYIDILCTKVKLLVFSFYECIFGKTVFSRETTSLYKSTGTV